MIKSSTGGGIATAATAAVALGACTPGEGWILFAACCCSSGVALILQRSAVEYVVILI
jgi:hypothetical protein